MSDYNVAINLTVNDRASATIQNLNTQLSGVGNNLTAAGQAADNTRGTWDRYKDAIAAVGVVWGTLQIAGQAVEFVQLGNSINATTAAFNALAGSDATQMMTDMRSATSGVATDMQLMQAANRYMMLGIADSNEEVSGLVEMAITLGRVMGQDAQESIEAFGALLANQSIPRLDNFGISSARVRDRVNELKEAGMNAQEAFTMAVMEQGAISLERLGDAADAGVTSIDRLSTRWGNFVNTVASGAATVVEDAFNTVEMIGGIIDAQSQLTEMNNPYGQFAGAAEGAQAYLGSINNGSSFDMTTGEYIPAANADVAPFVTSSVQVTQQQEDYYAALVAMYDAQEAVATGMEGWAAGFADLDMDALVEQANAFAAGFQESELHIQANADLIAGMDFSVLDGAAISASMTAAGWDKAAGAISQALVSAESMYDLTMLGSTTTVDGATYDRPTMDGTLLFTPEEAQYASEVSTYYSNLLADATLLHEQGLISDTELANVQSTADAASQLADQAERGAQAFENMTLSQAFGIGGMQGMGGEMANDVLNNMQAQGVSDADITQWQMATGTETLANMAYEQTIIPMITDIAATYGAEAGAAAIANVQTFLQNAQMTGMSDAEIAQNMGAATGYEYAYQQYDPTTGPYIGTDMSLTPVGGAQEESNPMVDDLAAMDESMISLLGNTDEFLGKFNDGSDGIDHMQQQLASMENRIGRMSNRTITLDLRFNTSAARGELGALIREIVGDNGGSVPGGGTDDHPGTGGT